MLGRVRSALRPPPQFMEARRPTRRPYNRAEARVQFMCVTGLISFDFRAIKSRE